MSSFEPLFKSNSDNFVEYALLPEGEEAKWIDKSRNAFIPQLNLRVKDTFSVLLKDPPLRLPLSIFGPKLRVNDIVSGISRNQDNELSVRPDIDLADVEFKQSKNFDLVYEITAKRVGQTLVRARRHSGGFDLATLRVVVQPSLSEVKDARTSARAIVGTPLENFEVGFMEGLATVSGSKNLSLLTTRIKEQPGQFCAGYVDGVVSGLWAGLKDLVEGLVEVGAIAPYLAAAGFAIANPGVGAAIIAFKLADPEFRRKAKEQATWAKSVAEAAKAVVDEFAKDRVGSVLKYLAASREAGRRVGEAFAAEIDNRAALGGAIEYGQWIGWAVGRIAFEVIVILVTEGIGEAVKGASAGGQGLKGLRVVGEGAELFARVRSKIQEILESLPALKNFVETLTKTKSAATAAEVAAKAKSLEEALQALARAKKAAEAAEAAAKAGGAADAAEAAVRARDAAQAAWEAAAKARTSVEAEAASAKAKAAADAAEQAAARAKLSPGPPKPPAPPQPSPQPTVTSPNMNIARETAGTGGVKAISGRRALDGSQKIAIEGDVLSESIARQNFEKNLVMGSDLGLPTYERSHLWGPRLGDEAAAGIWLGPKNFNIGEQARVEKLLQDLATNARQSGGRVQLRITGATHPPGTLPQNLRAHEFLSEVVYDFSVEKPGVAPLKGRVTINIGPPPNGGVQTRGAEILDRLGRP